MATGLQARDLPFDLDLGLFRAEGNRSRLEVYLGLDRRWVTYERERGRYAAHLAGVVLLKQRGQIVQFREMTIDDVVDYLDHGPHGVILKQAAFILTPGSYDLQVVVEDRQGNRSDSTLQVDVPGYGGRELEVSTIQLAGLVRRSAGPKEFFKRGLTVWPNAGSIYDDDRPLLWYYAEVYGLTLLDTVEIRTGVWQNSTEVISLGSRRTPSPSMVFCDWGAVNLSALTAGDYHLSLTIAVDGDSISALKPFRVVREAPAPSDSGDVLMGLSPAGLTDFARGLRLLPTELDPQRFRSTDSTGQRRMVEDAAREVAYGLVQDSSLHTGELLRRWRQVKAYDRDRRRLTEQGRTIFLYGPPAAIETFPATSIMREHQIWTYTYADSTDPSGQASRTGLFVFVDREGYGEFTLVHATAPGAVRNEDWRRELPWVPVPVDERATPAAEVIEEEAAAAVVDTVRAEPASGDSLVVPAAEVGEEDVVSAPVDTVRAEPAGGDSLVVPAAEVGGKDVVSAPVDTVWAEPASGDSLVVPAAEVGEEDVVSAPVDTVQAEPALIDTLTAPGPEALRDTLAVGTSAGQLSSSDTAAADTTAIDSSLLKPAVIDTTRMP